MYETHASALAKQYLALGGRRRTIMDDNKVSTRLWDGEPDEAARFWDENIAGLGDDEMREVQTLLPSINSEAG